MSPVCTHAWARFTLGHVGILNYNITLSQCMTRRVHFWILLMYKTRCPHDNTFISFHMYLFFNNKEKNIFHQLFQESDLGYCHEYPQSCETRVIKAGTHRKATAKLKRKYHSDYIQFGVFRSGDEEDRKPQCIFCYEMLANEAMKSAKLKCHLETKHKESMGMQWTKEAYKEGSLSVFCTWWKCKGYRSFIQGIPPDC